MCIGNPFRQDHHNRVAPDVRAPPLDLAVRVEHHAISLGIAAREPGSARQGFPRVRRSSRALRELLPVVRPSTLDAMWQMT
jgi:hypothetical protein